MQTITRTGNIYITGDRHGEFDVEQINHYCRTKNDILIVLGDAGLNYYLDGDGPACNSYDIANKETAEDADCTLFCIHGNHEERPYNVQIGRAHV